MYCVDKRRARPRHQHAPHRQNPMRQKMVWYVIHHVLVGVVLLPYPVIPYMLLPVHISYRLHWSVFQATSRKTTPRLSREFQIGHFKYPDMCFIFLWNSNVIYVRSIGRSSRIRMLTIISPRKFLPNLLYVAWFLPDIHKINYDQLWMTKPLYLSASFVKGPA